MQYANLSVFAAAFVTCVSFAQERNLIGKAPDSRVFVGQPLEDAKQAMSNRMIEFHEGGFAFSKGDPDESNLIVFVDKSHAWACVWYSKSKSQVTRIAMVFRPHLRAGKADASWLPATELVFHDDRSYSVKFKPPLTDEEVNNLEKKRTTSELPPVPSNKVQMKIELPVSPGSSK